MASSDSNEHPNGTALFALNAAALTAALAATDTKIPLIDIAAALAAYGALFALPLVAMDRLKMDATGKEDDGEKLALRVYYWIAGLAAVTAVAAFFLPIIILVWILFFAHLIMAFAPHSPVGHGNVYFTASLLSLVAFLSALVLPAATVAHRKIEKVQADACQAAGLKCKEKAGQSFSGPADLSHTQNIYFIWNAPSGGEHCSQEAGKQDAGKGEWVCFGPFIEEKKMKGAPPPPFDPYSGIVLPPKGQPWPPEAQKPERR